LRVLEKITAAAIVVAKLLTFGRNVSATPFTGGVTVAKGLRAFGGAAAFTPNVHALPLCRVFGAYHVPVLAHNARAGDVIAA